MVASALRCFDYSLRAHHDGSNSTEDSVSSLIGLYPIFSRLDRYVGNLDHSVSEDLLCALFSQIGVVRGCKIIREDSFILAADLRLPVPAEQRQAFLVHANDVMYSQNRPGRKLAKRTTEERSCRLRCRPLTFYLDAFEHYENDLDLDYSIEIESSMIYEVKRQKSVSHMRLIRFVPICRLECGADPSLESATAVALVSVILTSSCQRLVELPLAIA
ncbi:nucleolysin TIAR-like isoform X1 [Vespula squamosa]|uniref:Nucleolysin TIAR-like isoform X1 n=1 Tax=Vespula squamosa TaxID=30214 RepID=A0ABD2A6D2_VESSQ